MQTTTYPPTTTTPPPPTTVTTTPPNHTAVTGYPDGQYALAGGVLLLVGVVASIVARRRSRG